MTKLLPLGLFAVVVRAGWSVPAVAADTTSTSTNSSASSSSVGLSSGSDQFGMEHVGECTSTQLSELESALVDTVMGSDCIDVRSELSDISNAELCASPCWTSIEEHIDNFPDCDYQGVNMHSQFQQAMDQCASYTGNGAARGSSVSGVAAAGVATASAALVLYAL